MGCGGCSGRLRGFVGGAEGGEGAGAQAEGRRRTGGGRRGGGVRGDGQGVEGVHLGVGGGVATVALRGGEGAGRLGLGRILASGRGRQRQLPGAVRADFSCMTR